MCKYACSTVYTIDQTPKKQLKKFTQLIIGYERKYLSHS